MTETFINYFTEIEEHFRRVRGTPLFRLSSKDWVLIDEWRRGGIPLEAILRGIDTVFKKWCSRPGRARTETVNSLAYCTQAIAVEAQAMANAVPALREGAKPPFALEDVQVFVDRNAAALRTAGQEDLAASLAALDVDALYSDLEQLEQRLRAIEETMIVRLRATVSEEAMCEASRALDLELKPYRDRMTADQLAMLETQFLERRLLEAAGLPRLSLFYL